MSPQRWRPSDAQDDLLDDAIKGALRASLSQAAPPSDGWATLRSNVRAGPAKRRRMAGLRLQHLINGIVQGAAAMIVIAMLGASLTTGRPAEVSPLPTPVAVQVLAEVQMSSPPLYVPADIPAQHEIMQRSRSTAPIYMPARGDTLSMADLIKSRPPSNNVFNAALVTVFDPRTDPTLHFLTQ